MKTHVSILNTKEEEKIKIKDLYIGTWFISDSQIFIFIQIDTSGLGQYRAIHITQGEQNYDIRNGITCVFEANKEVQVLKNVRIKYD